jgi:hypothetical protein
MELTKSQIDDVELLYDNQLTDIAIAAQIGIDVRTLRRWQQLPEFAAELAEVHAAYRVHVRQRCLPVRLKRLGEKLDRYAALRRLIDERTDNADPAVPGDCTGLIIKRIINTKTGVHIEARVDHATLREVSRMENELSAEIVDDTPKVIINNKEMSRALQSTAPTVEPDQPQRTALLLNRAARRRAQKRPTGTNVQAKNSGQIRAVA